MRLFIYNCLLLASVAVALPNKHQKRDLSYFKNLVFGRSQINIKPEPVFQEENGYKLFRLPGYNDIIIKVAAKKPVVEEFVYPPAVEKVNLNAFGTVVGTNSNNDTLVAVRQVDNLLSTRILHERYNTVMKEIIVPMFPLINHDNYVVEEKINTSPAIETRPVVTKVIENRPVFTEVIENRPVISEVIRPLEENVEKNPFEYVRYSYKQIQGNDPLMTYTATAHDDPGVELLETIKTKTELPMSIMKRVDGAKVLGADQNRFASVQKVLQYRIPQIFEFSYPRLKTNSYVQNSFPMEVSTGFGTVANFAFPSQTLIRPSKDSPLLTTIAQAINRHPIPLHSHKPLNFEEDISASKDTVNSNTEKDQGFKNLGEKVNTSQTLGPIPPQYNITQVDKKGGNSVVSNENIKQMKGVPTVGSKDNVSNPNISVNVYQLQNTPYTRKVFKENRGLRKNTFVYVVAPVVNSQATKKDIPKDGNVVLTANRESVGKVSTNAPKQPLILTSIKHKPTALKDNTYYSYLKTNTDGSSLNVTGDKGGVSVSVLEIANRGRGDIPED